MVSLIFAIAGAIIILVGVTLLSIPAAVIVFGLFLIVFARLWALTDIKSPNDDKGTK